MQVDEEKMAGDSWVNGCLLCMEPVENARIIESVPGACAPFFDGTGSCHDCWESVPYTRLTASAGSTDLPVSVSALAGALHTVLGT